MALIGYTQYRDLYATLLGLGVTCPVGWLGAWLTVFQKYYLSSVAASQVSLKGKSLVDPDGIVVIVFCLHQWAGEAHRFDSAQCNTFFITHTSCDTNWSLKWRHAMPSELKFSNGSTRQSHQDQVRHGRHNFLNNSSNEFFIKNRPRHKWLKSNYPTLCRGVFFLNICFGKLFENLCL